MRSICTIETIPVMSRSYIPLASDVFVLQVTRSINRFSSIILWYGERARALARTIRVSTGK